MAIGLRIIGNQRASACLDVDTGIPWSSRLAAIVLCIVFQRPAAALIGEAQFAQGDVAQNVVLIRSAHGARCTGIVLARDIVLTAAHFTSDATELTVYRSTEAGAESYKVIAVAVHPHTTLGATPSLWLQPILRC